MIRWLRVRCLQRYYRLKYGDSFNVVTDRGMNPPTATLTYNYKHGNHRKLRELIAALKMLDLSDDGWISIEDDARNPVAVFRKLPKEE